MHLRSLVFLVCLLPTLAFAVPNVVVTLKPIHSLTARVMENVGTPTLLLPDGASPHTYQMKPSSFQALKNADLIIWVGPTLETFMGKGMKAIQPPQTLLTLTSLPNLKMLPQRFDREWHHHHDGDDHAHSHEGDDPHIWLSTENAAVIVDAVSQQLSKMDPEHAKQYQANANATKQALQNLHLNLQQQLTPYQSVPFLVYHDGYQYFEKEFSLNAKGTLLTNPHLPMSAYGLRKVREQIQSQNIKCVFRETEFSDKMIAENLKDLNVKIIELDPLGVHFPVGPQNYFQTMNKLGEDLKACLSPEASA
jgi:zinc transport system substrate-binding protein